MMIWPTPTPFAPGTPPLDLGVDPAAFGQTIAGGMVNGWAVFDAQGFASLVWFILLALLIIGGLMSIRAHLERL